MPKTTPIVSTTGTAKPTKEGGKPNGRGGQPNGSSSTGNRGKR